MVFNMTQIAGQPMRVLITRERLVPTDDPTQGVPSGIPSGDLSPQLTAFFTSALILASSAAVNSVSAK